MDKPAILIYTLNVGFTWRPVRHEAKTSLHTIVTSSQQTTFESGFGLQNCSLTNNQALL